MELSSSYIRVELDGDVAIATLARPEKRNALNEDFVRQLQDLFGEIPRTGLKALVLAADGDHFCAGLDLVEHWEKDRSAAEFTRICQGWHDAFTKMEYGGVPVIAALKGATVGGGLELASAAHVRVADQTTYFALPEGQRGIFTGGGATVRVSGLVGRARMVDMMLTGRVYHGQEAVDVGLCQYLVEGSSLDKALELAQKAASNPPLSNQAITAGLAHIQSMPALEAYYAEAFIAGVVNTQEESRERLRAFAEKTAHKVKPGQ